MDVSFSVGVARGGAGGVAFEVKQVSELLEAAPGPGPAADSHDVITARDDITAGQDTCGEWNKPHHGHPHHVDTDQVGGVWH